MDNMLIKLAILKIRWKNQCEGIERKSLDKITANLEWKHKWQVTITPAPADAIPAVMLLYGKENTVV